MPREWLLAVVIVRISRIRDRSNSGLQTKVTTAIILKIRCLDCSPDAFFHALFLFYATFRKIASAFFAKWQ